MSDKTKNMIDAATNQDGAAFKAEFDAAIAQRVGETLHTQRQDIAKNIFGNIRVPTTEAKKQMEFEPGGPGFGALVAKFEKEKNPKKRAKLRAEIDKRKKQHDLS